MHMERVLGGRFWGWFFLLDMVGQPLSRGTNEIEPQIFCTDYARDPIGHLCLRLDLKSGSGQFPWVLLSDIGLLKVMNFHSELALAPFPGGDWNEGVSIYLSLRLFSVFRKNNE